MIAVPSLLGISLVLFTVLAMAPGDPFAELVSNPNIPPEVAEALREKFGLNDPLLVRYWNWLTAMVQGDWGYSFISRINVETLIMQRIPVTLLVIGSSQILACALPFLWVCTLQLGLTLCLTKLPAPWPSLAFHCLHSSLAFC